ncbi:hypothetical protein BRADI_4g16687v3 [Brachypodium distachyon]|uniref:Uncharacterized protein n=1 Tax=Brachypodium distachyon TaxID=15368 RepID=A0A0Q3EL13_BRADI|nr:hypothetical protein BRADI_4g16687v3 [Brachypodium distachyon]
MQILPPFLFSSRILLLLLLLHCTLLPPPPTPREEHQDEMKSKRKIEMFDEKSKRACLPSVEDDEEEDTEEEKRVGGGRPVRHSEHCDPRGSHRDEPDGLGEGARGLIHSSMHDLSDDEPVEDGVRGVGHDTSMGDMHERGHGSYGLSSKLSIGREEEGDQHSEGRACGLDDGVCGLGT